MTEKPTLFSDSETRIVQFVREPVPKRLANQDDALSLYSHVPTQRLNQATDVHPRSSRTLLPSRKGCITALREKPQ